MLIWIVKSIIPCAMGWIACEIYHRITDDGGKS